MQEEPSLLNDQLQANVCNETIGNSNSLERCSSGTFGRQIETLPFFLVSYKST